MSARQRVLLRWVLRHTLLAGSATITDGGAHRRRRAADYGRATPSLRQRRPTSPRSEGCQPPRHSHLDCRCVLILIVARQTSSELGAGGGRMRRSTESPGLPSSDELIWQHGFETRRHLIFGGTQIPPCSWEADHGDPRAILDGHPPRQRRLGLNLRSAGLLWGSAAYVWARRAAAAWRFRFAPPRRSGIPDQGLTVSSDVGGCGFPQSRPNPRGGSTLSSSPRSSPQIASSLWASADSCRLAGRLSSHA